MSESVLCVACGVWTCRDDDAYCSYCGAPRAKLRIALLPDVLYAGELPPKVCVRLANDSCAPQDIRAINLPEWLSEAASPRSNIIPSAGSTSFFVMVNRPLEREGLGTIGVATLAGTARDEIAVIARDAKFTCEPERVSLWRTPDGRRNLSTIKLRPKRAGLKVLKVTSAGTKLDVVAAVASGGQMIDQDRSLDVGLGWSTVAGDSSQVSRIEDTSETLVVTYQTPHGPGTVECKVLVGRCRPPDLFWPKEFENPEVRFQTSGQRVKFELGNFTRNDNGLRNGPLIVERAELAAPLLPQARIRCSTPLPIEVGGGSTVPLEFELDLSEEQGRPEQLTDLTLRVGTNLATREWKASLKIEPMPAFGGVVAIDFGSSNSCCAVWQEGKETALLTLDDRSGEVSPTVVRYRRLTPPPDIETGARPKDFAAQSADIAASTADRLKQRLADARSVITIRPEEEGRWVERQIADVAADYLRNIRHKAELAMGTKFRDFILTHPARCSLRQYKNLRHALTAAFGAGDDEIRVQFLPEPVAALISYIAGRETTGDVARSDYVVAAFDLGGGTTDISIIKVRYRDGRNGQVRIVPEVLYSSGDRFGGEDLTDYLRDALAARVRTWIARDEFKSANGMTDEPRLITQDGQGAATETVRLNQNGLRKVAESFKLSLSDQSAPLAATFQIHLQVGSETGIYSIRFADLRQIGGTDLASEFLDYVGEQVRTRVEMLEAAFESCGVVPDVIQISGKTSHLPIVREALREAFPSISIMRAPDPKECVVKGACLTRSMRRGVYIDFKMDKPYLTSTIGAYSLSGTAFQSVLSVGQQIPPDGLNGVLRQAWDGSEPIVLWEDLKGSQRDVAESEAERYFSKLGTWIPETRRELADGELWDIRLRLKDFQIDVTAVGPNAEVVAFRPV